MSTRTFEYERVGPAPESPRAEQRMVRMRDGVRLATEVYLPEGDAGRAPGPTVLIRLPYDKDGSYTFIPLIAEHIVARGYRVVAQDVRGKFRSEGETLLFVNEARDGHDTLAWIEQQEWSDGIVGMWGDSYYGYTQWAAVSSGHPALRAISPRVTGTRLGELPQLAPGAEAMEVEMGVHRLYPVTMFHSNDVYYWEPDWSSRPYIASVERFLAAVGERSISFDQWWPHPVLLRRFPDGSPFAARPVPVLQTIGWWDNCAPWQWEDHRELAQRPAWALNEYLLIDSIDHEGYHLARGERVAGAVRGRAAPAGRRVARPDAGVLRRLSPRHGAGRLDPARALAPGARRGGAARGAVVAAAGDAAADPARHRRRAARAGRRDPSAGAAGGGDVLRWTHDPDDLVPSPVGNAFAFLLESPDEQAWSLRDDVLVFDGEPVGARAARSRRRGRLRGGRRQRRAGLRPVRAPARRRARRRRPPDRARPAARPARRRRARAPDRPRPGRLPPAPRSPAAAPRRLQRLPGVHAAAGHGREPVDGRRGPPQRPDPAGGRAADARRLLRSGSGAPARRA